MNAILNFMKRNYKLILFVAILSAVFFSFLPKKINASNDPEKDKLLIELLTFVVDRIHYSPVAIDDTFSQGVYKNFIDNLDPFKRYFTKDDIAEFDQYKNSIDDQIKAKDISFFNTVYDRLMIRTKESKSYYTDILSNKFDYTANETFNTDYEKMDFTANKPELIERWRKQVKLSTLSSLTDKIKFDEDIRNGVIDRKIDSLSKTDNVKLLKSFQKTKKENGTPKSFEELEKETRESTLKSLNEYFSFMSDMTRDEYFAIYLNTIAEQFDPHTSYMAPEDKEKFDASMSGKFFGIGARLQKKNDYTEITELISGGPAWKNKALEQGDIIMKVAQGDDEAVDVVGMRLDDVVKKIRGPKGTEVKLTVKRADGTIHVISIIRDEVEFEETYAKSSIVEKDGKKYGIVYLPKFYINFDNRDDRDAAKDVTKEIDYLKKEGVSGIIMDVRDNGGGSLKTVVDIAGLFIEKGPIVQVKSSGKAKEVLSDTDSTLQWDGPLVVLINNFSASASEILAAAIQDYKRGIVLGSKHSFGKGTVQNVYPFNNFIRNSQFGDLGALKTTTQKFYRIDGGSTQLKGVSSDVALPDRFSHIDFGERDTDNAMPWDKIDPANYTPWKIANYEQVILQSKKRISENAQFKLVDENAQWIKKRRDEYNYSLNLNQFKKEQDQMTSETKRFNKISDYKNNLIFKPISKEIPLMENDTLFKEKRTRWFESLAKDIYVEEGINVLQDLQKSNKTVTNKSKKGKLVGSL